MSVHSSAVIADGAVFQPRAQWGLYCTIGSGVVLGEECNLISHVVLDGRTRIGARNTFYSFCAIGVAPQDLKYRRRADRVGDRRRQTIRENVTISRGTVRRRGSDATGQRLLY